MDKFITELNSIAVEINIIGYGNLLEGEIYYKLGKLSNRLENVIEKIEQLNSTPGFDYTEYDQSGSEDVKNDEEFYIEL